MKKIIIKIATDNVGMRKSIPVGLLAKVVNDDWAIHKTIYMDSSDTVRHIKKEPNAYTVTHIRSGMAAATDLTKENAVRLAKLLSKIKVTWDGKGKLPSEFQAAVRSKNRRLQK